MDSLNLFILIPTYNEASNIDKLLKLIFNEAKLIHNVNFNIFILDDSSPDGTAYIAKKLENKLKNNHFKITTFIRDKKEGVGRAYLFGFNKLKALKPKKNCFLLLMDADLSHNPIYIKKMITKARENKEFVVGSRYIKGGSIDGWKWYRKILSISGNFYARLLLGNNFTDYTSGFNLVSFNLLNKINLLSLDIPGYGFFINFKYQIAKFTEKIDEIPIKLKDRLNGKSKMPSTTILTSLFLVIKIRLTTIKENNFK